MTGDKARQAIRLNSPAQPLFTIPKRTVTYYCYYNLEVEGNVAGTGIESTALNLGRTRLFHRLELFRKLTHVTGSGTDRLDFILDATVQTCKYTSGHYIRALLPSKVL